MVDKVPVRVNYNGLNPDGLAEYQTGETIASEFLPKNSWTFIQDTTPTAPTIGDSWYQSSTAYVFVRKSTGWERITVDDQLADDTETNTIDAGHF